ncbi:hypothetical protein ACFSKU_20065 [Pontibacter silvestris]|uniref:Uncharacterized protein n=1 Tax=Pontibacter silvestris TaxID=2305183 RepID=A0ABW4X4Q7_9BACT|nr:hypothetical protein [Pontibacter silvestris]MCC9134820.1 hypothetical protein [Pontibacter silvestris]
MSYYYTVREYATNKGLELSFYEEIQVEVKATRRSNELGVPINRIGTKRLNRRLKCYSQKVLKEIFKPALA